MTAKKKEINQSKNKSLCHGNPNPSMYATIFFYLPMIHESMRWPSGMRLFMRSSGWEETHQEIVVVRCV